MVETVGLSSSKRILLVSGDRALLGEGGVYITTHRFPPDQSRNALET